MSSCRSIEATRTPTPASLPPTATCVVDLRTKPGVSAFATLPATTASPFCVARRPDTAALIAWLRLMAEPVLDSDQIRGAGASPDHVQQILHHLVAGGDDPGVRRIGLLGDDQLAEFIGDIGVGAFERAADDPARRPEDGRPRFVCRREGPS